MVAAIKVLPFFISNTFRAWIITYVWSKEKCAVNGPHFIAHAAKWPASARKSSNLHLTRGAHTLKRAARLNYQLELRVCARKMSYALCGCLCYNYTAATRPPLNTPHRILTYGNKLVINLKYIYTYLGLRERTRRAGAFIESAKWPYLFRDLSIACTTYSYKYVWHGPLSASGTMHKAHDALFHFLYPEYVVQYTFITHGESEVLRPARAEIIKLKANDVVPEIRSLQWEMQFVFDATGWRIKFAACDAFELWSPSTREEINWICA